MIFLPTEIISLIFEHITNNQDQLNLQLVCHYFHEPAKRGFYNKVVIAQVHDDKNLDYNKTRTLVNFIHAMINAKGGSISLPGQYVKQLYIDFAVVLETKFMPTVSDFQLFARSCPHLEEFHFPVTMFWNYLIAAHTNQSWKRLKRVPEFRITPIMNPYQLDRFFHFKSSLTSLDIDYFHSNETQQPFQEMIRLFTNLERLKIRTSTQCFTGIIPTLSECCPKLIEFNMHTTSSIEDTDTIHLVVPRLARLELGVRTMSIHTVNAILKNFPDLQCLVLRMQQSSVIVGLDQLISYVTSKLSQSSLHLFMSPNDFTTTIQQFTQCTRPIINVTYDSRSSFTTGVPDLSFVQRYNYRELFVRYQGSISSLIPRQDLPHMKLIQKHGFSIQQLKIQSPSSLLLSEKAALPGESPSCLQHILTDCPNLSSLIISRCYFDLTPICFIANQLQSLVLDASVITSASLSHLSRACHQIKFLELNQCELGDTVHMPEIDFKRFLFNSKCQAATITIHELHRNTITHCSYTNKDRDLTLLTEKPSHIDFTITCNAMDQFRFNHIPLYK